jgi:lipopolysaccharide cholinephosphotransferase
MAQVKVALFGARNEMAYIVSQLPAQESIAFIVDNDSLKHGTSILGIDVVPVEQISLSQIDKVYILVGDVISAREQLLAIGVQCEKITIPPKSLLAKGVFYNGVVREAAKDFASALTSMAGQSKLRLFVEAGTLLGLARSGDLITWDNDLDFSLLINESQKVNDVISNVLDELVPTFQLKYSVNLINGRVKSVDGKIIVKSEGADTHVPFEIINRYFVGDLCVSDCGKIFEVNRRFFESYNDVWIESRIFRFPNHWADYLALLYGHDWQIPNANFRFSDYQTS